jgi:hypothetical protein
LNSTKKLNKIGKYKETKQNGTAQKKLNKIPSNTIFSFSSYRELASSPSFRPKLFLLLPLNSSGKPARRNRNNWKF